MKTRGNKKYFIMNIIAVTLVLLVTAFMFIYFNKTSSTVAAGENTIEIRVDKVTTVSIYAFGEGVELIESTNNYDVYTAEIGTNVRLQAVNETRIFENWVISNLTTGDVPTIADLTNNIINFTVTESMSDLSITVNRRNATQEDYGKYMTDRFIIVDEVDLIALQNILDGNGTDSDYSLFYENPESYNNDSKKAALKEDLRFGYFLISNNFTVFNEKFTGLGTKTEPFQGIVCGKNNINSTIFLTINNVETPGESSYGLFRYLGNEALIRHLNVTTSIGINSPIEANLTNQQKNQYTSNAPIIYAGGLAGVMDRSTLINVTVSTSIGIASTYASNINAGGLFGSIKSGSGIDSVSDVTYDGTDSSWSIVSHKEGSIINAGLIAGSAVDSYIKEVNLIVTNQIVDLKNDSVTNKYTNSKLYLGNVFGTYVAEDETKTIDDIMIMGDSGESLRVVTSNGDAAVGGLIGYVDGNQTGKLNIEKVYFRALNDENEFTSSSIETTNVTNLYAGGVIGLIDGNNVIALDAFRDRFQEVDLDDENTINVANYLYEGNYTIETVQNGTSFAVTNGKSIAGGIVGKGYINLEGTIDNRSDLAIASPTSTFTVEAVQSKLASTNGTFNDKEHACAALVYGSVGNNRVVISNINVYTNNTTINTTREIGTDAIGDLHTGGFISYATNSSFSNIGLYLNNSILIAESLSDLGHNSNEGTNSAFCGGFTGELDNNSSLTNVEFAGYDVNYLTITGTTSYLESIQNTKPAGVNINYGGENYIGGIVGRIQYSTLTSCKFYGSTTNKDYIRMNGHRSPDSAFCGGLVGLIRTGGTNLVSSVIDCEVRNTEVSGSATCTNTGYNDPDIYVGGVIGAAYIHGTGNNERITVSNCRLINSDVYALGNERIAAFAGGILGGSTWESSILVNNCYVTDSSVASNIVTTINYDKTLQSTAGGIMGGMKGDPADMYVNIQNSAVIDTNIEALVNSNDRTISAYAAGILGFRENSNQNSNRVVLNNCYSNAVITSNHNNGGTANVYGIAFNCSFTNNTYSYYLSKNVNSADNNLGVALASGPFEVTAYASNPYRAYNGLNSSYGYGQKLYIEKIGEANEFTITNALGTAPKVSASSDGITLAHVWININQNGGVDGSSNLIVPDHHDKETAAKNGWFILDYVLLYRGTIDSISSDLTDIDASYKNETSTYEHKYTDLDSDSINDHYLENIQNNSDKILNNYIEKDVVDNVKEFEFYVYDDMLSLNVEFNITHFSSNYRMLFKNTSDEIIDEGIFKQKYGSITLELVEKHTNSISDKYNLIFKPNEKLENDVTFFIYFVAGNNEYTASTSFKVTLHANKLTLVGVTYADYTPPVNYFEDQNMLGTNSLPYHLYVGSVTKFIPIFTKSNDLQQGIRYILEEYIEKCTYSVDNATDQYFDIHSNGELNTGNNVNQNGTLTVTYGTDTVTLYVLSVKEINVSYSVSGSDVEGLTVASNTTDFYFEQYIKSNYSGVPTSASITIGSTVYSIIDLNNKNANINVYEITKERAISNTPITSYNPNAYGYVIRVDNSLIINSVNNISVNIDYPIVYTITFKLQCETFNDSLDAEDLTKSFKIISGTSFKEYFTTDGVINPEITNWISDAELFGYVFTGFYLVNDANSIHSYGISFEDLAASSYVVNSSLTFYGRWSYLIEIIEASGTHIKTGFNSAFMQEYTGDGFTRAIQIPINANQGYVFRVDTDASYVGRPGIEAYVVTKDGSGNKVMTEVEIETYQNNSSLYYIRPEYIVGYLIIKTTVSNSDVIVGEHTSSITEDIAPEDGIITFKYIVNHVNKGDNKSYIYNLSSGKDYETLPIEFVLDFYKQSDHSDLVLPDLTEIRCYYNRYVNGSSTPEKTIIGTYITHNDDRVYLTEFKLLDLETPALATNRTFGDVLGNNETVTEIFYFTITPPNGYTNKVKNEIANYVVECGFVDGQSEPHQEINYLKGKRTETELANPNDLNDIVSPSTDYETSRQYKVYQIIPTRNTSLEEENNGTYTFTDDKTYSIYDIILTNTQKLPDFSYISLYDDDRQSLVESSVMSFNIKKLSLRLGYRLGNVAVYGYDKEHDVWEKVTDINVNSAIYQEYEVDFKDSEGNYPYYAYRIDNTSTNEIRLTNIDVLSGVNGVLYEGNVVDLFEKSVDSENKIYTYSLEHEIVGDSRHDGKTFMLAIQVADASNKEMLISDIDGGIYILINGIGLNINHYVALNTNRGKNTAYLNLTEIIEVLNVDSINFNIVVPAQYQIYTARLLEVTNEFKPASGEVRVEFTHHHYFIDGECYCGVVDPTYESPIHEFALMLVGDFNAEGGNSETSIEQFYSTSANNIKDIWTDRTMLHKYQWFLTYVRDTITAQATLNNALTDSNYLNAIAMLNAMIVGYHPTDIFDTDYTAGSELVRYFIESLINFKSPTQISAPVKYSKFMVDYSAAEYRNEFLAEYEKSKVTINIAVRSNTGGTTGASGTEGINALYMCDTDILTKNGGDNNLQYQSKIALYKVEDNVYKVVKVVYDTANHGESNTMTDGSITWTHALVTVYPLDIIELYSDFEGKYLYINDEFVNNITTTANNVDNFIQAFKNQTYDGGFKATVLSDYVEDTPNEWVGNPVNDTPIEILRYYNNSSSIDGQHNKVYLCNTDVPTYNNLRTQYKLVLCYDAEKAAYKVVAKATSAANTSVTNLTSGITWTHCIASSAINVTTYANVGQYIIFTDSNDNVLAGDSLENVYKGTNTFNANVYNADQWQ